jgi:hypothetical protein
MMLRASQFFCEAAGVVSSLVLKPKELAQSEPDRKRELERLQNELKMLDETPCDVDQVSKSVQHDLV